MVDHEFLETVAEFQGSDLASKVIALKCIHQWPSGDHRIIPVLKVLLDDKTLCVVGLPFLYGEIRYLAPYALYAELKACNSNEIVHLPSIVKPLDTEDFTKISASANIACAGGVDGVLGTLKILQELELLPRYSLTL